jgi:O-antigen polymerase
MQQILPQYNKRSVIYAYAIIAVVIFLMLSVIFGHISGNLKLWAGSFIFLALLAGAYLDASNVFLVVIFFLPVLIGADRYQINIGAFLKIFLPVNELYANPFSLACLFLFFLAAVELFKRILKIFRTPLFYILSLSTILSLIIFWQSQYKLAGAVFEIYLLAGFLAYFLGYFLLGSKKGYLKTIFIIILSAIIPSAVGIYQFIIGDYFFENDSSLGRLASTFPHSNTFGSYLFVTLTVALVAFLALKAIRPVNQQNGLKKNNHLQSGIYIFLGILALLLVLTYSRTAWIGIAFTLLAIAILKPKLRLAITYSGSLLLFLGMFYEKIQQRFLGIFQHYMFDSMYGRREIWDMALFAAQKKPFLGYGIGSFGDVIMGVQGKETGNVYPHNDAIRFLLEGGIVGIISYLLYMLGALYYAVRSYVRYPKIVESLEFFGRQLEIDFKLLGIIPLLLFGIMIVISTVEAPSMDFVYQILAWTLLGSWLGMSQEHWRKKLP